MGDEAEHLRDTDPNIADTDDQFDYLQMTEASAAVTKNLAQMGEQLKKLKLDMITKEAEFKQAEKEYNYYASSILPMEMFNAGVSELKLMSGGLMKYERKFYCQPNKNAADKKIMADWLHKNGGGHLVKAAATVDGAQIDALKAAAIPFTEIADMNTNSLKAFLKDKIGAAGGMVQIQIQDIPACMHFQEVGLVSIDV